MKKVKTLVLLFTFASIFCAENKAQEKKLNTEIGGDFVSRYVWRGTQFSSAPSIQPSAELQMKNLAIGAWGSYSLNASDGAETDLYASYSFLKEMFTVTITDYFFPDEFIENNNYFEYSANKTSHILEGSLMFNGTDQLPLSLLVAANFFGADAKKINSDANNPNFNTEDGLQYSTYLELSYNTKINETEAIFFAGFTPNKPAKQNNQTNYIGETGFYGKTMGFVNIGTTMTKKVQITEKYDLPVNVSIITNPMNENIFFVFGFSL